MRILDNLLCEKEFRYIQEYFLHKLPWNYLDHCASRGNEIEDKENFQFTHTFCSAKDAYLERATKREHSSVIKPILYKLHPWLLLRVKANLRTKTPEHVRSALHTDLREIGQLTAIYYLNTCDGYTMFQDGTKVSSVENRLLIFDGNDLHCGTSPTDSKVRMVLNINYFPEDTKDGSKYMPDESVCGQPTKWNALKF